MTKVHPNATISPEFGSPDVGAPAGDGDEVVLTVWRKSLLFNCSGFTVYDSKGDLVFRVDNYGPGGKAELVLMDGAGKALLTVRRKGCLNLFAENWLIYNGEESSGPIFSVKKRVILRPSEKSIARVAGGAGGRYGVEGSYAKRRCEIYDELRRAVAEVRPDGKIREQGEKIAERLQKNRGDTRNLPRFTLEMRATSCKEVPLYV